MYLQSSSVRVFSSWCVVLLVMVTFALSACAGQASQNTTTHWAPPAMPDTPAGRQVAAYLTTFNAGDKDALSTFVDAHMSPVGPGGSTIEDSKRNHQRLYDISRGLNVYQISESHETDVTIVAQFRLTQEWRQMTFFVEATPPHLITGIRIQPVDAPVGAGASGLSEEQIVQQLDAYVRGLTDADRFSGVVLVAKEGRPIFESAYGQANIEANIANTMTTRFNLASAGKMFTAIAIGQLVEQGKLAYEAPFGTYLPDYPAEVAQTVTLEHLLTHRSGIVDFFIDMKRFKTVQGSENPQRDYLPLFKNEPLRFRPGERFEYSNSNYILLGAIIERVSGQPYEDYVREHIFLPAGMDATSISGLDGDVGSRARGYTQLGTDGVLGSGSRRPADSEAPAVGSAAGGAFSTAGDLLKFDRALRGNLLLGAETTKQLLTDRVDYERPGYRYAYGFIVRQAGAERIVGHSGGFPGVDAQFEMYQRSGYTVIVLANYELVGESVAMWLQQTLAQR